MADYANDGSESEDDFNPVAEIDEDDVKAATTTSAKQRVVDDEDDDDDTKPAVDEEGDVGGGDDDEENEDDEDEEDDEEDEDEDDVVARPAKRRKKAGRNMFIDVEAEVDEDEEEEDENDEDIGDEMHPDDLLEPTGADLDDRHHRELDMRREANAQKDVEELAKEFDEKYRRREMQSARRGAAGAVPLALPTVNDPPIWLCKCRPGKEREIILSVQKRIDERIRAKRPVKVYSAFERGPTGPQSGYLYVEADSKQDMLDILDGISNVFMGGEQFAIEVKERPDLLRKKKRSPLEVNKFVRMLRPPTYRGDLAKVVEVSPNGLDCVVQLVPRLDYGLNEDANASVDGKRKRGFFGRQTERPPPKLFNEAEAKKRHMKFLGMTGSGNQRIYTYKNNEYQNGFLILEAKVNQVSSEHVNPKMEELQFFSIQNADGTETMDLLAVQAAQKATDSSSAFAAGDNVEIFVGEQKGIRGTTITVIGEIVSLKVSEGDLKGRRIDAPVKTLRKLFREGDHVKVIGGSKYVDEVGLVTKIRDDKITLLCDSTQQEITVFSKDLKRAADSATVGAESNFDLYDLVQIDASTIGCIVRVDREVIRVLDQAGDVRTLLHTQVSQVVGRNKFAVATDRDGSEIRHEDNVKEFGGEGRQGKVLYIHRGTLFIQNRELVENQGIFVVRSNNVITMAAKSGRAQAQGPDLGGLNPALNAGLNGAGGGAMPPPRTFGRDKLIGKTVVIRRGPHKGLLGIVKDTMGDEARVELHTKSKHISIKKEVLTVKDPITGATVDIGGRFPNRSRGGGGGGGGFPGSTPVHNSGNRTPHWGNAASGGRTPGWGGGAAAGGRTPSWGGASGGRTPGWGGDGGRTAYGGNDGGRTAYGGGDGNRTAYGGATAYGGNDGSRTAYGGFNAGGRTPGWGGSGNSSTTTTSKPTSLTAPTPGAYNAPTPGAYAAPTPGGYGAYNAPTPGGPPMDAPTPGNYSAPTPGDTGGYKYGATPAAAAPTPGAWDPATPAPSGDDGRYD